MPQLFLMRHGQAEAQAPRDSERNLTDRGREETRQVAARLLKPFGETPTHSHNKDNTADSAERGAVATDPSNSTPCQIERIYSSPYNRAQQTAELVQQALAQSALAKPPIDTLDFITPDDPALKVVHWLEDQQADRLLLTTHQPLIGELVALLAGYDNYSVPNLGTSALVGLEAEVIGLGCMWVRWIETP